MNGIKACIWDMDHTLYSCATTAVPGFEKAVINFLRAEGIGADIISDTEVTEKIEEYYIRYGTSYPYFEERFSISHDRIVTEVPKFLKPDGVIVCQELPTLFATSKRRHVINTHANIVWSKTVLAHIGLAPFFMTEDIIHHTDYNFHGKHEFETTHRAALARTGVAAHQAVMIDDAPANLRIPSEMGMKTILIAKEKPADMPSYIDTVVSRAADVFTLLS